MFPMVSFVSWNIRGIGSNGSLERLLLFKQQFHFPLLCLQEPMVACDKMDKFRRKLGFHQAYNNSSNKIWILWLNDIDDEVIHDWEQHVFLKVIHNVDQIFFLSVIYAKCTELRKNLWAELRVIANIIQDPWGATCDFNVVVSSDEKFGRRLHKMEETLDFIECLNECGLQDAGFSGSKFPWCDSRDPLTLFGEDWIDLFITLYGMICIMLLILLTYPERARTMLYFWLR